MISPELLTGNYIKNTYINQKNNSKEQPNKKQQQLVRHTLSGQELISTLYCDRFITTQKTVLLMVTK